MSRKEWVQDLDYFPECGSYVLLTKYDSRIGSQECLRSTSPQPHKQVDNFWEDGFELSSVKYLEDRWWVFAQRPATGLIKRIQLILFDPHYPEADIKECISQGKEIMFLHYSNRQWVLVADKQLKPLHGPNTFYQEVFTFSSFPSEFIKDRVWANDKVVKHIASNVSANHGTGATGNTAILWAVVIGNREDKNHTQELYSYSSWPGSVLTNIVGAGTTSIHSIHYDTPHDTWYLITERKTEHVVPHPTNPHPVVSSLSIKYSHQPPFDRLKEMGVSQ